MIQLNMQKKIMLLVDANSLLHRAYHAYPLNLTAPDGSIVNATYGFTSMLLDVLAKIGPKYVVVAFDTKAPTFRHKEYTGYKANRPQTDSELISQVQKTKDILKALNIPVFEKKGFEADDILGTLVALTKKEYKNNIDKVLILTGDKDMFQLVDDFVHVVLPKGSFKNLQEFGPKQVVEKLGVTPEQVVDFKALMGDPSDNIPGVKGIGPKTAKDLLLQYKSLENIYKNLDKIAQEKKRVANLLEQDQENAILSKKLARIKKDVPIVFSLEDAVLKEFDYTEAVQSFTKLQFKSLLPKLQLLAQKFGTNTQVSANGFKMDFNLEHFKKQIQDIVMYLKAKQLLETELNFDDWYELFINKTKVQHFDNIEDFVDYVVQNTNSGTGKNIEVQHIVFYKSKKEVFIIAIKDLKIKIKDFNIIFWNWWQFAQDLQETSLQTQQKIVDKNLQVLDLQLISYGLSSGRKDLEFADLVTAYLQIPLTQTRNLKTLDKIKLQFFVLLSQLEKAVEIISLNKPFLNLVGKTDPYAVLGVALMQENGISLDLDKVLKYSEILKQELAKTEQEIYDSVGYTFNIRSTQQLGQVLFETLKLPYGKKTKTGYSTSVEVLHSLQGAHPVIDLLLQYRKLQKIYSTYVKPFLELRQGDIKLQTEDQEQLSGTVQQSLFANSSNNKIGKNIIRIHSKFDPMRTSTGRLASSDPNLQNLPIRTDEGKKIREFFVPEEGYVFISFDYSQIDLRVLAHLSQDKALVEAFKQGRDIHRETASKIFGKPYDKITKDERRIAKTINFGLVYGMGAYGLATRLGIEQKEAKQFIEEYFKHFVGVKEYIEKTEKFVLTHHYVVSLLGRRRYIYGVDSNNRMRKAAALREAINMPIQGGSDDILRSAISKIVRFREVISREVRLVLQIHDELVFEVPNSKKAIDNWINKTVNTMESAVKLSVPLKVGYEVTDSLGK